VLNSIRKGGLLFCTTLKSNKIAKASSANFSKPAALIVHIIYYISFSSFNKHMKKTIAFLFVSLCAGTMTQAQLAHTKWKNTMMIPEAVECFIDFAKDTVKIIVADEDALIETMSFTIKNDTLTIVKLSGLSPCDTETSGKYKFEVKDDRLTIVPISDDCQGRLEAFLPDAWIRQKK
jgi:hypothetical protein